MRKPSVNACESASETVPEDADRKRIKRSRTQECEKIERKRVEIGTFRKLNETDYYPAFESRKFPAEKK